MKRGRPLGATAARSAEIEQQISAVLEADHPQSVRHVYYRVCSRENPLIEKTESGYRRVQSRTVIMRRAETLPYEWIVDLSRAGYYTPTYANVSEYLMETQAGYHWDLWQESDHYCEVWCESRSIAAVLLPVCRELRVSLYPAGGFTSLTLAFEAASGINAANPQKKPVSIFYFGDWDAQGEQIPKKIRKEIRKHLDPGIKLEFVVLGLNAQQVKQYKLPRKPGKQGRRWSVEAEALPAHILRELFRTAIETLLPPRALRQAKIEDEMGREAIQLLANMRRGQFQ
jgi:hypothetical protein